MNTLPDEHEAEPFELSTNYKAKSVAEIFKERIANMKKQMMPELSLADQLEFRNP